LQKAASKQTNKSEGHKKTGFHEAGFGILRKPQWL
jgi:hypothetical protein